MSSSTSTPNPLPQANPVAASTLNSDATPASQRRRQPPVKQRMALSLKSLVASAQKLVLGESPADPNSNTAQAATDLFPVTSAAVDGDDCDHDCDSCHVKYPRGFKIDDEDVLYGHIKGWSTHVIVATGKSDWVRDVADEKGSVMEAFDKAASPDNGRMMLSASNIPTPHMTTDYSEPTTVVLLPAFAVIENVTPAAVPTLVESFINRSPTNTTPLSEPPLSIPRSVLVPDLPDAQALTARPSPHSVLILLCSHKTRDARCGQSAPLLKKEIERHLRPLGLCRDFDDQRPGGVGIYFINHVGGHKYSANVMVYRRPNAFGVDSVERAKLAPGEQLKLKLWKPAPPPKAKAAETNGTADGGGEARTKTNGHDDTQTKTDAVENGTSGTSDGDGDDELLREEGAAQCMWLARIKPEDCENLVKYTILQGKVVKPETQLRGGFDRCTSLVSW